MKVRNISSDIASEPLSEDRANWFRVAPNHLLSVSSDRQVKVELMDIERHGSNLKVPLLDQSILDERTDQESVRELNS
jgi:hypothetical protein